MIMAETRFYETGGKQELSVDVLRTLLDDLTPPFSKGDSVGIKLHWGEKGNHSYLPPIFAKEIVRWLKEGGMKPFVFDTTVLYSGGRRTGPDSLKTAAEHGYSEDNLGCPVVIADGIDGRDVMDIAAGYKHFKNVQVAGILAKSHKYIVFSHFKGHIASGIGGAIKNISMGFASRAQKQRMHADVHPVLKQKRCTKCGMCVEICPADAVQFGQDGYPSFDPEKCMGCAQCIATCPEIALQILWGTDFVVFQEKLIETAAAVWKLINDKTIFINALLNITADCDCLSGENPVIYNDMGFVTGKHPVDADWESIKLVGPEPFEKAHPHVPWQAQFDHAKKIGFSDVA
jgi:hypothetical protein